LSSARTTTAGSRPRPEIDQPHGAIWISAEPSDDAARRVSSKVLPDERKTGVTRCLERAGGRLARPGVSVERVSGHVRPRP
jgi:hypothetical protein